MSRQRQRRMFWVVALLALVALGLTSLMMEGSQGPSYGRTWTNIDYVGDGITGHLLDIYLPAKGSGPFPAVIMIYGSAWTSDHGKGEFGKVLAGVLCPVGFATIAINHRSSLKSIFPAQIHDVKAAVRFVRASAEAYSLDPDRIAVWGASSGGHLAALLGTSSGVGAYTVGGTTMSIEGILGKHLTTSSRVQAVSDWCGATDFLTLNDCYYTKDHNAKDSPASLLIGGPIQEHPEECALANPITYVDSKDPPFFIAHGSNDPQVPWCQSQKLHDALRAAGAPSTFTLVAGAGHTDLGTEKTLADTIAFLKEVLHP